MSSSQPRIAIVGGGPAGLTLGLLLHKHSIQSTIFELREKLTEKDLAQPSGMLDLHGKSGLVAIRECGLYEHFIQLTGECSEAQRVSDKGANIKYQDEGEMSSRPEISRHSLTKLLSSSLPSESVRHEHKLHLVTPITTPDGFETELDFGPNRRQRFDLVIGADWAWSQVRRLLTDVKPRYTGTQCITTTIRNVTTKFPHLAEFVGLGSFSALGSRHCIMSQRGPQDSARIYIFLTTPDEQFATTAGIAGQTAADAKRKLLGDGALLGTFGSILKELVTVACDEENTDNPGATMDIKPLYTLPVGVSWEPKANTTLIGDAAHLMCPWTGEGVNLAMWDSLTLAHTIVKAHETLKTDDTSFQNVLRSLLKEFEAEMTARAKESAEETYSNGRVLFGKNGAMASRDFFLSVYDQIHLTKE